MLRNENKNDFAKARKSGTTRNRAGSDTVLGMYDIDQIKNTIICGDALMETKKIPNDSVDTIITSCPYWGLRDYGKATNMIWDGDLDCEHRGK